MPPCHRAEHGAGLGRVEEGVGKNRAVLHPKHDGVAFAHSLGSCARQAFTDKDGQRRPTPRGGLFQQDIIPLMRYTPAG